MMLRFAFTVMLALHAWSSVLLAGECGYFNGAPVICPEENTFPRAEDLARLGSSYMISGRPKSDDDNPELTATKGDIDALNKRLDRLEGLIRCKAEGPFYGTNPPCP
jgi:hypothetical protein